MQDEWTKLREEAEKVDESLDEIKEDFAEITQEQVLEFALSGTSPWRAKRVSKQISKCVHKP